MKTKINHKACNFYFKIFLCLLLFASFFIHPIELFAQFQNLGKVQDKFKSIPKENLRLFTTLDSHLYSKLMKIEKSGDLERNVSLKKYKDPLIQIDDLNRVRVEVGVPEVRNKYSTKLRELGCEIKYENNKFKRYDCWLPILSIEKVAKLDFVSFIRAIELPITNEVVSVGDTVHRTIDVRNAFPYNGSNIKVGIISTGVDHLSNSVDAGELPNNVQVINNRFVDDEGTAMLEIVHDLAPGSELAFADKGFSESDFANNIDLLQQAGCQIICDDIAYFHEPSFQEGIISNKVQEFVNSGGLYISSAGNDRKNHYIGDYYNAGDNWNRFELTGGGFSNYLTITAKHFLTFKIWLQWNEEYGASNDDYDLYLTDDNWNVVDSSVTVQNGSNDPYEIISHTYLVGFDEYKTYHIFIKNRNGNATPRKLNLWIYKALLEAQGRKHESSTFGHCTSAYCISTAAVYPYFPNSLENYSSEGPVLIYSYDSNGDPISFTERIKPDISAVDGVQTFVGQQGNFPNPFSGTSAAAPHIAGIAALLWSIDINKNNIQIRDAIENTAVNLPDPQSTKNNQFGEGRADAYDAALLFVPHVIIQQVQFDKTSYLPNEPATITVTLADNLAGADVSFQVNNSTPIATTDMGNGVYQKTFNVPSQTGQYPVIVYAAKDGYLDATPYQTTLTVSNPNEGHDFKAQSFTLNRTNIDPGQSVTLQGSVKNNGIYSETNVPVVFTLKDPNGNIVNSATDFVTLQPNFVSQIFEHTFSTSPNGPEGFYLSEIRTQLSTDFDPSNDFLQQSVYVGPSPDYGQYETDFLEVLVRNVPYTANGYIHTYLARGTSGGRKFCQLKVEKVGSGNPETKFCYKNDITKYDNENYAMIYRADFGADCAFDYGFPSNSINIEPNQLIVDAGIPGYYHVVTSANNPELDHPMYGEDGEIVDPWLSNANQNGTEFDILVNAPLSAERRTYNYWATIFASGDYAQILRLIVHEPHNIKALSILPSNGTTDTIGNTISIEGVFQNAGGYDEPSVNIKLQIDGPSSFQFIGNQYLNIPQGTQSTAQFSFNTLGLNPGQYAITLTAIVPNDPYPDNIVSSNINLIERPNQAPLVTITSPSGGDEFSFPDIVVTGTASDPTMNLGKEVLKNKSLIGLASNEGKFLNPDNITIVLVKVNDGNWDPANGLSNWNISATLNEGLNTIYAKSIDDQGVESNTDSVTVMYNIPPIVTITFPNEGDIFTDSLITVEGTASDPDGTIVLVQVKLNNGSWQNANGTTTWNLPITLISGTNTINARSKDDADSYSDIVSVTVYYNTAYQISGAVTYDNSNNTPLSNINLNLMQGNNLINSTSTNTSGNYSFPNVSDGSYSIESSTNKPWGGGNSADALLIMRHWAGLETLSGLRYTAADVNASGTITNADALQVMRRWAGVINSFNSGDWAFDQVNFNVNGSDVTENFKGICFGDVNGTYTPSVIMKPAGNVYAVSNESAYLDESGTVDIPVVVKGNTKISSMSLVLNYPEDLLTIKSITPGLNGMIYNTIDGTIKTAWASLESVIVDGERTLFTITVKVKEKLKDRKIQITVDPASEFTDDRAKVIEGIKISIPVISGYLPSEFTLSDNYPNPFNPSTLIEYSLPADAQVKMEVYNILGERVSVLVDKLQKPGKYQVMWNAIELPSGVYIYRFTAFNEHKNFSKIKKMLLVK